MASSESDQPEVIADVEDVEEQLKSISIRESSKTGKNIQDVSGKSQLDTSARSGKDSSDDLMSDVVDDGSTSNSETTSLHGHTTLLHGPEDHNCDVHAKGDNPVVSSLDATNTADVECRGNNNICAAGGSQPHTVTEEIVDDQPPILRSEESEEMDGKEGDGLETEDSGREEVRDEENCEGNSEEEVIVTDGVTTDQVTQGDGAAPDTSAQFDPHCPPSSEQTCTVMHSVTKIDIHSSTSLLPADVGHDVDVEAEGTFGPGAAMTTDLHIPAAASACDGDEVRSSTKDAALNESAGEMTLVMVGTKMNEESESEIISDTLLLQGSQQPDYVPDTRDEVNVLCDSKVDALRILPVEEGKAKELVTENTTELKQTESSHTDKINISDSAKQIQSETLLTLDGFTPEKKIEEKHNTCGEGELEEAVVGADSDVRPKSSSSVRSVSPGKCVRKRSGRGSKNPPGMGYSDLLRKTTEKSVDWEERMLQEILSQERRTGRRKRGRTKTSLRETPLTRSTWNNSRTLMMGV